jgi:hypothetical protein
MTLMYEVLSGPVHHDHTEQNSLFCHSFLFFNYCPTVGRVSYFSLPHEMLGKGPGFFLYFMEVTNEAVTK